MRNLPKHLFLSCSMGVLLAIYAPATNAESCNILQPNGKDSLTCSTTIDISSQYQYSRSIDYRKSDDVTKSSTASHLKTLGFKASTELQRNFIVELSGSGQVGSDKKYNFLSTPPTEQNNLTAISDLKISLGNRIKNPLWSNSSFLLTAFYAPSGYKTKNPFDTPQNFISTTGTAAGGDVLFQYYTFENENKRNKAANKVNLSIPLTVDVGASYLGATKIETTTGDSYGNSHMEYVIKPGIRAEISEIPMLSGFTFIPEAQYNVKIGTLKVTGADNYTSSRYNGDFKLGTGIKYKFDKNDPHFAKWSIELDYAHDWFSNLTKDFFLPSALSKSTVTKDKSGDTITMHLRYKFNTPDF